MLQDIVDKIAKVVGAEVVLLPPERGHRMVRMVLSGREVVRYEVRMKDEDGAKRLATRAYVFGLTPDDIMGMAAEVRG